METEDSVGRTDGLGRRAWGETREDGRRGFLTRQRPISTAPSVRVGEVP